MNNVHIRLVLKHLASMPGEITALGGKSFDIMQKHNSIYNIYVVLKRKENLLCRQL